MQKPKATEVSEDTMRRLVIELAKIEAAATHLTHMARIIRSRLEDVIEAAARFDVVLFRESPVSREVVGGQPGRRVMMHRKEKA